MRRVGRSAGVGLLVAVLALVTAGCAGVPERGPVVAAGRVEPPRVPLFANPPKSGDTAEGIVKGFLDAGRDFHQNHAVARQFVADGGSRWQALAPVVVLDREPCIRLVSVDGVPVPGADTKRCTLPAGVRAEPAPKLPKPRDGQTATVRVEGDIQARIDGLGRYSMTAEPMPDYEHDLTLIARKGEWRITAPPDGLVLVASLLQFTFSPVPLYFPQRLGDPGAGDAGAGEGADPPVSTWLVPDVRWFPSDLEPPAIASMAVRALLAGPSPWLGAAVDSGAARDVTLAPLEGVRFVADGVARVDLTKAPPHPRLLRSQVLATLQSLPSEAGGPVTDVAFTVKQLALDVPPGQAPGIWPGSADAPPGQSGLEQPGSLAAGAPLCLTPKGQVGVLRVAEQSSCVARDELATLSGAAAGRLPASDRRGSLYALLTAGRDAVWATTPVARGPRRVLSGPQLTAPSVDDVGRPGGGWVWAASSVAGGPLLASTLDTRRQVTVDVPWLGEGRITAMRISPEGSRALVVVERATGTQVLVSGVVRAAGGRPLRLAGPPLSLVPDLASATDAVWRSPDRVAVLGVRHGQARQTFVWTARVGGEVEPLVDAAIADREAPEGLAVSGTTIDVYVRTAGGRRALGNVGGTWSPVPVQALAMPG